MIKLSIYFIFLNYLSFLLRTSLTIAIKIPQQDSFSDHVVFWTKSPHSPLDLLHYEATQGSGGQTKKPTATREGFTPQPITPI